MPQNGLIGSCETILLLMLQHPAGTLGLPVDHDLLLRRDDLPARATALNVFAALFTILMLVIISVWLIFRFVRQTLANVSATVTGSTTSSSATSTSESDHVWRTATHGFVVNKEGRRVVTGEVRRPGPRG
ncbi:hypothetical protein QBC34DRAFT_436665 [Podospora aff. communis PSN243]|uniref:Uncharacterized protein n=1 Tax=Podospora aff. communis PSN243 TaxID=3040156 RepID=A0AAV9GT97_9PEZI|nr:hypothetical protein QBC34DRAFT_436665 [Podospora aff. communis PSN243]